jgi:hypothetical protein
MKAIFLTIATIASLSLAEAPVGELFPDMRAESLNDKTISLPTQTKGKCTIVCLSYSEEAETDLKTWYEPTYDKFIAKTGMMDAAYDIGLYFIPMFTDSKTSLLPMVRKRMKAEIQADIQPHILLYKGELEPYKTKLKMADKKKPYIFLLDKTGKIIYSTYGAYTEDKMDAIDDLIE